jgi:Uma2 family endonuclease
MAIATRLTGIDGEPVDRFMTAEQFLASRDRLPRFAQLIDGEVVVSSPSARHQDVVLQLARRLLEWIEAGSGRGRCGIPVDVRLDERSVYEPDVWWVSDLRKIGPHTDYFLGPPNIPDLAVEVLSPSTRGKDLGVKCDRYEQHGLAELWVIDPETVTATMWRRSAPRVPTFDVTVERERDDVLESPLLPGFAVRLVNLFPRVPGSWSIDSIPVSRIRPSRGGPRRAPGGARGR